MDLIDLVARWGLPLVLAAVVLEQGGLPLPAAPLLVVAGALADAGPLHAEQLLGIAVLGCLLADHAWFGGFATLDDPRLVVVVFVENGGHGGAAAAPLARQLFAKRFGKLLPPEPRKDVIAVRRFPSPVSRLPASAPPSGGAP